MKLRYLFVVLALLAGVHQSSAIVLLSDNFDNNSLDLAKWTTNTTWNPSGSTPQVIATNQRVKFINRGYLNTVTNYDPSAPGGLLITGTWTILHNGSGDAPTVATRSSGIPQPYNVGSGEVSDGVRFKLQPPQNGFQLLILGTGGATVSGYYEISNTLNIAEGDTVSFAITDDGTNLAFNVAKIGNPTNSAYATAFCTNHLGANLISFYNREDYSNSSALDDLLVQTIQPTNIVQLTNLVVSPASPVIATGSNEQFTATGYFDDGSLQVLSNGIVWSSSSPAVASISTNGLATGLTSGATTITATSGSIAGNTTLTVTAVLTNIVVTPANLAIAINSNQQFTATGYFNDSSSQILTSNLTWSSSSPTVATINSSGLATGVTNATIMITATSGSVSGFTYLTVVAPPGISTQSTNGTVSSNGSVTLNVGATGGGLSFQWQFNGTNISGATGASLTLTNYSTTNIGVYTIVISNAAGSITSLPIVIATVDIKMFAGVIVNGPIGSNYLIQARGTLGVNTNWTTLTNIALPTQPYVYIDYSTPFNSQQFYRALPNWTNTIAINFGVTWTAQNSGNQNWRSVASSADGTKLVAVGSGGQISTSTNSGLMWTQRSGNPYWSVASSADGTKLVAIPYYAGQFIFTSTDSGASWTTRVIGGSQDWLSVASSADGTKLVAVVYGGQIYTSTDSGVTWTAHASFQNWYSVASSSDGTKLVAVVYGGQIYTSTDSGVTWTPRDSNRNWYSVASSSDGTKLVAVDNNAGQIYTSTDSGVTWTPRDSNRGWASVASSSDGTKLVAVDSYGSGSGGKIYTSTDSGVTWTPRDSNRNWISVASSSDGTKLVAVVNGGQIYTSSP